MGNIWLFLPPCLGYGRITPPPDVRNESATCPGSGVTWFRARDEEAGLTDAIRPRRVMAYALLN